MLKRIMGRVRVIHRSDNNLRIYRLKKEEQGVIYFGAFSMPKDDVTVLYDNKITYYLVGELEPSEYGHLEVASSLFRSKFFKALLRDYFSFTEYINLIVSAVAIAMMLYMYNELQAFYTLINPGGQ